MLTKKIAFGLLATSMLAAPALAQSNPPATPATPSVNQPATSAPATAPGPGGVQFYTQTSGSDWRASKFMGVDIYGSNNEKIGDVNDIILDHTGNIQAVVIGVGGFLGIGEKDVAIPFKTVEWMDQPMRTSSTAATNMNTANNNAATNNTVASNDAPNNTTLGAGMGTGNNTAATANRPAGTDVTGTTVASAHRGYPDHGVLRMTKDQLKAAPTYRYPDDTRATAQ
jgi:sporulation protein YlmC with PRC-barrel domain